MNITKSATVPEYHNQCYECRMNGFNYCTTEDMCYDTIAQPCNKGTLITDAYPIKSCGYAYLCEEIEVDVNNSPVYKGSTNWKSFTFDQY